MAVQQIHHYSISAPASIIGEMIDFYSQLLGLTKGFRPDFGIPGCWLYAGNHPLLHLVEDENRAEMPKGYFDHIALRCDDLPGIIEKLETMGLKSKPFYNPEIGQAQIFINDSAGTMIELNFLVSKQE